MGSWQPGPKSLSEDLEEIKSLLLSDLDTARKHFDSLRSKCRFIHMNTCVLDACRSSLLKMQCCKITHMRNLVLSSRKGLEEEVAKEILRSKALEVI